MNWAWASSFDQIWSSPALPMWMMLAAAGFFGLILLVTLLRAERSVANGALTVIALLAIAIALAAVVRVDGPAGQTTPTEARAQAAMTASLPALSCLDDLAGDAVAMGCEKALFGAPDAAAAAVSTTAARIDRLTALGDAATAEKSLTPDIKVLRKSLERDRYGLVAHVLVARDGCTQFDCAAFRSLTDQQRVAANMDSHLYDTLVARYAPTWNAPAAAQSLPATAALAGLPPSMPTGKPTNAEFPSASSTPPVSIMNPEPPTRQAAPTANAAAPRAPAAASAQAAAPAAKKPPAPKAARAPAAAPVPLTPPAAAAPAADNE
ncbi:MULTISPECIES: hypothetical protein [Bradyrhizobium]|jgi:hypothetical protein|uniref:Uncharacterized protein n=1 Tax=Bradyrhizobium canariense TaxID=255045 RepID=A0ABX3X3B5_9BRAD|nr:MULTISPECIES: hypothetical protein [Bradyrhizobium]MCK1518745.1 hypothetical protein [Bradyrhizobium sp. 17]MCK1686100.1 hypothetical protein [Bradyrhizobium sp. 145]OSI23020.1 hypothetical protein BST65_23845 [Bradyrhizobium canariense]OSI30036.1 hypothetical protein BST66_23875 [Bradyrhizobium canariense]OSI38348.1 hypothetical protein BSZ20_35925 [Bradyrhizobium canariense]